MQLLTPPGQQSSAENGGLALAPKTAPVSSPAAATPQKEFVLESVLQSTPKLSLTDNAMALVREQSTDTVTKIRARAQELENYKASKILATYLQQVEAQWRATHQLNKGREPYLELCRAVQIGKMSEQLVLCKDGVKLMRFKRDYSYAPVTDLKILPLSEMTAPFNLDHIQKAAATLRHSAKELIHAVRQLRKSGSPDFPKLEGVGKTEMPAVRPKTPAAKTEINDAPLSAAEHSYYRMVNKLEKVGGYVAGGVVFLNCLDSSLAGAIISAWLARHIVGLGIEIACWAIKKPPTHPAPQTVK